MQFEVFFVWIPCFQMRLCQKKYSSSKDFALSVQCANFEIDMLYDCGRFRAIFSSPLPFLSSSLAVTTPVRCKYVVPVLSVVRASVRINPGHNLYVYPWISKYFGAVLLLEV